MVAKKTLSTAPDVAALLADAALPHRSIVLALREAILATDAAIGEAVKWNAPSFHVGGAHFATMHLRGTRLQLVLHLGARKRAMPKPAIDDPQGLLDWRGEDRALLAFASADDVIATRDAWQPVLRQWMAYV
ncbi:DUF1801 domain-containing protein [Pseudoxanthomonas putridarboris]|uniref:DUF1801 domain-containing protein n=1 Tax=Pseudoxanthomonas putridarboris TaxID=752605 RepID=A0ABU9IW34_9GAMM